MLLISRLFIYPVKSLGGIELTQATLTDRGFAYDRRWMLIDENNRFLTQREVPGMALLQVGLQDSGLLITHKITGAQLQIPFRPATGESVEAIIWDDAGTVQLVDARADFWFSEQLGKRCRLVFMPDAFERKVDRNFAGNNETTSLSDGYPLLIIGQASLDDLNSRLDSPLPINRFRPNIVFTGGYPYQEDEMKNFRVNQVRFFGVKLCGRCIIPTIDQNNGVAGKEPLKTLASYRLKNNKVYFGQNLLFHGQGTLHTGDEIHPTRAERQ